MDPLARTALERLPDAPGGRALLGAAEGFAGLWLVGGAVRDALLGAAPRDLDVAVEGDVEPVAAALGEVRERHERFGTAEVAVPGGGSVNLARTRTESYAAPGALPDVRPAGIDEDLARRDFTVNAIAVGLSPDVRGAVRAAGHALDDAAARRLRVLHDASFADDPTRLLRLARYAARLDLDVEERTVALAARAVADGALARTVSGDRIGREVRLLLAERDPLAALAAAAPALAGTLSAPDADAARAALALLPAGDGRPDLLVLASGATGGDAGALDVSLAALAFTAADRRRAGAAARAPELATALAAAERPSAIAAAADGWPPEAVALAGALGPEAAARAWLDDLRHARLAIDGRDLIAAGVPEGPEVGRRLRRALAARLDGELAPGRDAELAAALAG